ncbi:MAG: hypothetical protein L0Y54_14860 [Sporichthyaceae bacterium]|nr:hypothetical protein [Sporichthyaceae bacterium]
MLAVDRDPLSVAVARANATALGLADRVELRCADVTTLDLAGERVDAVFCDPARRTGAGQRVFQLAGYQPPWSFVRDLPGRVPATGIKVAPGIPLGLIPLGAEAEWVSDRGEVKEAALWFGPLSSGVNRRATLLPSGASLTDDPQAELAPPPVGSVGRYLYEPDGAVIRAQLVAAAAARLDAHLIDPRLAYLSSDTRSDSVFGTGYRVADVLPFQLKRLRAALRERDIGTVTVKKRGSAIDPEQLRRRLRLTGSQSIVIVLTRIGRQPTVILADPLR